MLNFSEAYWKSWALDAWFGCLDSGFPGAWSLDARTLDTWTLGSWTLVELTLGDQTLDSFSMVVSHYKTNEKTPKPCRKGSNKKVIKMSTFRENSLFVVRA